MTATNKDRLDLPTLKRLDSGYRVNEIIRSYLKKVFSPELGVEPSSQVLDILQYACGLRLGLALISDENLNFEIASRKHRSAGLCERGFNTPRIE